MVRQRILGTWTEKTYIHKNCDLSLITIEIDYSYEGFLCTARRCQAAAWVYHQSAEGRAEGLCTKSVYRWRKEKEGRGEEAVEKSESGEEARAAGGR